MGRLEPELIVCTAIGLASGFGAGRAMTSAMHVIAGPPSEFSVRLAAQLAAAPAIASTLINADMDPDPAGIVQRCRLFAEAARPGGALVLTILRATPPGLNQFDRHAANTVLWAFTRQSALAWAPRGLRVNAIGLGPGPVGLSDACQPEPGAASRIAAAPASIEDVVRCIHAIARFASMTGQLIRLGSV